MEQFMLSFIAAIEIITVKTVFLWNAGKRNFKLLVPVLRCVNFDTFETPCFVVEDKHCLDEEMGNDVRKINNGITLVKPRKEGWPKEFL